MTTQDHAFPALRREKLSVLSALLGPDTLARLRADGHDLPELPPGTDPAALDPDRVAWHRSKLMERVRGRSGRPDPIPPPAEIPSSPGKRHPRSPATPDALSRPPLDQRLATHADEATLSGEHPAVIARLLQGMGQADRIAVLKTLPGPIARSVVQRLR